MRALQVSSSGLTTVYLGFDAPFHSERRSSASTTTWVDYLDVAGEEIGAVTTTASGGTVTYFVPDHLGSVATVTAGAVGANGSVTQTANQSYDAWGKRRYHRYLLWPSLLPRAVPTTIDVRVATGADLQSADPGLVDVLFDAAGASPAYEITLRQESVSRRVTVDWLTGHVAVSP